MGEGHGTPVERVATGSGWVNDVFLGERTAFRNHEPLVGNTNAVEPRIFSPYHAPRSLERAGDGLVSKDEVCCS